LGTPNQTVREDQAQVETKRQPQWSSESDARLAARLKQLLETPGISDKDRKLVERNLQRLVEAQETRRAL
jgi:hypothetical protein